MDVTGDVHCWGSNDSGQLLAPKGAFVQVSAGYRSSCGVESTGKIACWGVDNGNDEDFGQVTDAPTEAGFVAVEVGWHHVCALREDGERTCWGQDDLGQSSP